MSDIVSDLESSANLLELFKKRSDEFPNKCLYTQAFAIGNSDKNIIWKDTSAGEAFSATLRLASYLQVNNVSVGDRVAIIAQNRPEWMIADLAILAIGAVSVSIYPTLTAKEIGYILFDSGAKVVIAENAEQLAKLNELNEISQILGYNN